MIGPPVILALVISRWHKIMNLDYLWFGTTSSLGEPPMNPFQGLAGAAAFSAFSLFLFGWVTIPAGALLGGLMIGRSRISPT
ncbi:hypothetical protein Thi970DRAFT_01304 [Thiorhodovibrio frisius]|uniref:Uncharacterized protein n=2 Tax=Thiorhodovibrio frisius TaxID=631362 RepID=H8YYV2_9GAMM|nr:hypothetical protein Thi970DRAFT_01304 [Thiorhodovibrio frisius]WPL23284.1 hypothetical protein Thiofri_03469 [Thiorhodovibrio frisius]